MQSAGKTAETSGIVYTSAELSAGAAVKPFTDFPMTPPFMLILKKVLKEYDTEFYPDAQKQTRAVMQSGIVKRTDDRIFNFIYLYDGYKKTCLKMSRFFVYT